MKNLAIAAGIAAALATGVAAQDIKTETQVKVDDAKAVVYTGCLGTGTDASYVLEDAAPVVAKDTKTVTSVDSTGLPQTTTTTTTKYLLLPGDKVDLKKVVGNKVEVTAILIPKGDDHSQVETKTKTEVNGKRTQDVETKEKIAQGDAPQLRVLSVKQLADRCTA
jgi:hypothetical protein